MKPIKVKYLQNSILPLVFYPKSKGSRWFKISNDLEITLSNDDVIIIPEGFKTDLVTSPKILWSIVPPFGVDVLAYIIHDYLYHTKQYSRSFSDQEMQRWAKGLSDQSFTPKLIYIIIRAFGWYRWLQIQKTNENKRLLQ